MKKRNIVGIFISILIIGLFISPYFFIKIKLIGESNMTLDYGEKYSESGYKGYKFNENITKDIKVTNNIKDEIGTYKVTYTYKFLFYKIKKNRIVKVKDISAPIVSLNGEKSVEVTVNTEYEELGATAIDNLDGDVTKNIKITNNVNINEIGDYEVIYEVIDKSGNKEEVKRSVKVERKRPTQMSISEYSLDGWYDEVKLKETKNYGNDYFNKITMVGDSNTMYMYLEGILPSKNAWAIPCLHPGTMLTDNINLYGYGIQMKLLDAVSKYKPPYIYLNLGSFGTAWLSEQHFKEKSVTIIEKIKELSPDSKIVLISVYPVSKKENVPKITQDKINKFNFIILEIAYEQNIKYLDVQEVLKADDGYIKPEYVLTDNYHLTNLGHKKVREYINTHALEEI